ncbi:MAG: hypothetical protein QOI98_2638 [Solirubrobacteraceae bacterium]|nr:hypothetical protein [Solirubrobacteraceae bacterium]
MTADVTQAYEWRGRTAVDCDGDKVGKLDEIYLDQETGEPEWALVSTGPFGSRSTFVPLVGASLSGQSVCLNWDKSTIKDAPSIEPEGDLSHEEEAQLCRHYGLPYAGFRSNTGHDTGGPNTEDAMTRSEEEPAVGKSRQERGRVRLKKFVATEQVQTTVPVEREVARLEREPITEGNVDQALDGPSISDDGDVER